jgi:hypothetical protein
MMTYTFTLALEGELYAFRTQPQERLEELSRAIQQLVQDHFRNVSLDAPVAINVGEVGVRQASLQGPAFFLGYSSKLISSEVNVSLRGSRPNIES